MVPVFAIGDWNSPSRHKGLGQKPRHGVLASPVQEAIGHRRR